MLFRLPDKVDKYASRRGRTGGLGKRPARRKLTQDELMEVRENLRIAIEMGLAYVPDPRDRKRAR